MATALSFSSKEGKFARRIPILGRMGIAIVGLDICFYKKSRLVIFHEDSACLNCSVYLNSCST